MFTNNRRKTITNTDTLNGIFVVEAYSSNPALKIQLQSALP